MTRLGMHSKKGALKYQKIVEWIEASVVSKEFRIGDRLPSINDICTAQRLSRDTVLLAFRMLKERGIVQSVPGKGYFIKSENIAVQQKVFLLFDELNSFKEDLYNSFIQHMGKEVQVDLFFHHFNASVMRSLIRDHLGLYSHYVIMPAHVKGVQQMIEILPKNQVYLLDQTSEALKKYPAVYQNFENGIYNCLHRIAAFFSKYNRFVLLFDSQRQPLGILKGFEKFTEVSQMEQRVISSLENRIPKKGEVYFVLDDTNLIVLIKKIRKEQLVLGKDIGIISYNDTLLKEVFEGGITTISTDFKKMGAQLSDMIQKNEKSQVENEIYYVIRKSL